MRSVIVLPTYNEGENIEPFLRAVRKAAPTTDILVVDDNSPDGTGAIAESVGAELGRVDVLHRADKQGLGSAYRDGFATVLAGDHLAGVYDVVISMDADFSHDPAQIPDFVELIAGGADVVIGSRYVLGGGTTDWPVHRQLLSKWGNTYTRGILGVSARDCTSGYRAYRASSLAAIEPTSTTAEGYAFLTELVRRLTRNGATVVETPIIFRDRTRGKSKMSGRIIVESMMLVTAWGMLDRWRRLTGRGIELMQEPNERRPILTILIATLIVGLPLIVAVIVLAQRRWFPVLDLAMTEFRVRDVGGRYTPLIGLPGRIGTFPDQGSHPGPLSFWLIAPGYRLFGSSAWAMEAATVTVQLAWISVALWIGHRRAGLAGVVVIAAVLAVLTRGYGLTVLVQPWNPYLPVFAWIVVLLATWSVLCGDHMMLIPLAVAATFCAQTHIPYLTIAGALGLLSVGVVLVRCWRSDDRRSFVRPLAWTGGVFAVLWLGPLADQVRRDPGNIRRLLDHFTSPTEDAIGLRTAFEVLLRHMDIVDGYGALLTGTQRFLQVGYEPDGRVWPGALLLALWIAAVVVAVRLHHRSLVALHTVIGVTLVLSLLSMARIFGKIWYYLTLWAWGTTTLMIVAIVWTAVAWLTTPDSDHSTQPSTQPSTQGSRLRSTRQIGLVGGAILAAVFIVSMVVIAPATDHPEEHLGETIGELLQPTIEALDDGVGSADGHDGRYVVRYSDSYFFGSQAYGLVSELERAGFDAGMHEPWRVPVTQHRVIPVEQTTAEVIWATGGFVEEWRNDDRVVEVAAFDPRSADERAEYDELRAALIDDLRSDGLDDLVPEVDTDLFSMYLDPRLSTDSQDRVVRMLFLGQETAVFIGPPGVTA